VHESGLIENFGNRRVEPRKYVEAEIPSDPPVFGVAKLTFD
jgi:hypothetical protein